MCASRSHLLSQRQIQPVEAFICVQRQREVQVHFCGMLVCFAILRRVHESNQHFYIARALHAKRPQACDGTESQNGNKARVSSNAKG